jgi:hypothetical protein
MKKTFREILAEKDEEYTYHVKSTVDIHNPEWFERVRMSLMPYQIKSLAPDGYTPYTANNKTFPNQPNSPTFTVKVVTGLPVDTQRALETMAMICHIHRSHLYMSPEDDVASEIVGKPQEVSSADSQLLVGAKRIGEFMKELQSDRKDREEKFVTREVYESFFTTHRALEHAVKKPIRNGYYMVEMLREGDHTYMRAEGPFATRPDGNEYRDKIAVRLAKIVTEQTTGAMYSVLAETQIDGQAVNSKMFEVGVSDLNSGRRYTSMVRAESPDIARQMAVRQVAEANKIDPEHLSAMAPKPSASAPLMWSENRQKL